MCLACSLCFLLALRVKISAALVLPTNGSHFTLPLFASAPLTKPPTSLALDFDRKWPSAGVKIKKPWFGFHSFEIMEYGDSFPVALGPFISQSIYSIHDRLHVAGLPIDDLPFTIQQGSVHLHVLLIEPASVSIGDLELVLRYFAFWTEYDGPREVKHAEIVAEAEWDSGVWETLAAIQLAIEEEEGIATKK